VRPALVDDQLLSSVLRRKTPKALVRRDIFTTGLWYVRLCQAVLGSDEPDGELSRPFGELSDDLRHRARMALIALPPEFGLVSLRDLGPRIGELRRIFSLNALSMEVVAAAQHLDADVFLATPSPPLERALGVLGVRTRVLTLR
jgi:hypothetical protein